MADSEKGKSRQNSADIAIPGIEETYVRFSVHNPSIPSKYMTFFRQQEKMLGFGASSKRRLSPKVENTTSYNASAMLQHNDAALNYCGNHRRQRSMPEHSMPKIKREQKYFRYIFIGKAAQEKATINQQGIILQENTKQNRIAKPHISTQSMYKLRLQNMKELNDKINPPSESEPGSDKEEVTECQPNNYYNDGYSSTKVVQKPAEMPVRKLRRKNTRLLFHGISNPGLQPQANIEEAISAKQLLIEQTIQRAKMIREASQNQSSNIALPKVIKDNFDVAKIMKELRKHSINKESEQPICFREFKLSQNAFNRKPLNLMRTEYVPKENIERTSHEQIPGPGTYNLNNKWMLGEKGTSIKGSSNFASRSKKLLNQMRTSTDAIYNPLNPQNRVSFQINLENKWV